MPAEHMRPDGLSQGYFCFRCGGVTNMIASGHGVGFCEPNPKFVQQLIMLNKPEPPVRLASLPNQTTPPLNQIRTYFLELFDDAKKNHNERVTIMKYASVQPHLLDSPKNDGWTRKRIEESDDEQIKRDLPVFCAFCFKQRG